MQIQPPEKLLPYIRHYLFLESEGQAIKTFRLFSDGSTGMVFTFKNKLISSAQSITGFYYLPDSFIYGPISEYKDLYVLNSTSLIIAVFQPSSLSRLLKMPATELGGKVIDSKEIFGSQVSMLHEKLYHPKNTEEKINLLNTFFSTLIPERPIPNQILIDASLAFISKNGGTVAVKQLVEFTGYTERHVERIFSESIGINPKKFGNIVKLHVFLKKLNQKPGKRDLTAICHEAGYFDQSHLIREFRKHTGITPTEYLNNTGKLAINFMQIGRATQRMSDLYNFEK